MKLTTRNMVQRCAAATTGLILAGPIAACSAPEDDAGENPTESASVAEQTTGTDETQITNAKNDEAEETAESSEADEKAGAEEAVGFDDAVARAVDGDDMMAPIFGVLTNESAKDIEITGFSTSADAKVNQIHEVVDGQMKEMEDPLVVPAHGEVALEPGGTHFMMMELGNPVKPGQNLSLTLETSNGDVTFDTVPVRTMNAGAEGYEDLN